MPKPQPWTWSLRWKSYWGGPYVLPRAVNDGEEPLDGEWFRRAEAEKYMTEQADTNRQLCFNLDEAQQVAEKYQEQVVALQAFRTAIIGWRENDWSEGFDRHTAEMLIQWGIEHE